MKWKNKGHEFDSMAEQIMTMLQTRKLYLFGAGQYGKRCKRILHNIGIEIAAFLDNNQSLYDTGCEGSAVLPLSCIQPEDSLVLLTLAHGNVNRENIIVQLTDAGFSNEKKNLIDFSDRILSILYWYKAHKVFISGCSAAITQKCSLNCKYCSVFTPYISQPDHVALKSLKEDLDAYFSVVDYTGLFNLLGGEPFLYPQLHELLEYIGAKHYDKMDTLELTTNATIIPDNELLDTMNRLHMQVTISDYTNSLPHLKEKVKCFVEKLRLYPDIHISLFTVDKWIDFGYEYVDRSDTPDEQLIRFFDTCRTPCRLLKDKTFYYCANSRFAQDVGLVKGGDLCNAFDLARFDLERDAKRLLEFNMGYSDKGYVELCKRCNGYLTVNCNFIGVAEQASRL